ncbi:MAG TPA: SUMF1/EgtB/PvdO family nonheme iron enzyme [Candidatus Dormibacteraeota bacterium]|nr:SUMF1/EgtB/PvdO family nonheme iron enzyme [Candidatus Dormibacteraeota bacterium]
MMRTALFALLSLLAASVATPFSRAPPPDAVERRDVYAAGTAVLIIGLSDYRDRSWPRLAAARDAQRVRRLFLDRGVPAAAITLVEPEPEDANALTQALVRFGESLPSAASQLRVVVYVAGHGYTADGIGYLVPPTAPSPTADPAAFKIAALPLQTLLGRIAAFRARDILVILDACFSGLALESLPRERFPHPPDSSSTSPRVVQVITAGTAGQTVADDGLFAELVAAGLTGSADLNLDGWVSGTELGMYLRLRLTEATRGRQTPRFGNVIGMNGASAGENWFASVQMPVAAGTGSSVDRGSGLAAFRDCEDCPLLRVVPGARTAVRAPYIAMGVREVTFQEYDACYRAAGCRHWPWSASAARSQWPVTDVSWRDAVEYTTWLSCVSGGRYRLPTEAEWLEVARPELTRMKQSVEAGGALAVNCRGCGGTWSGASAPAGSFSPSELGLYDVLGNVWQWMNDCRDAERGSGECRARAVRGGAFTTRRSVVLELPGAQLSPRVRDRNIGFRVVRDLEATTPGARLSCEAP